MQATVIRSSNKRNVTIHIVSSTSIIVKAPPTFPSEKIKKLIQEHTPWIRAKQQALQGRTTKAPDEYLYLGKPYQLATRHDQKEIVEFSDKLYIASTNKTFIKTYLTSWYKQEARKIISERVQLYAQKADLTYRSVAITSAETRWGSCSSQKTLNFNWKLVMAPLEVIDYVIAHELAHLTELNHSQNFWGKVRKMYPLYRQYRTWLKRHGHLLQI